MNVKTTVTQGQGDWCRDHISDEISIDGIVLGWINRFTDDGSITMCNNDTMEEVSVLSWEAAFLSLTGTTENN